MHIKETKYKNYTTIKETFKLYRIQDVDGKIRYLHLK